MSVLRKIADLSSACSCYPAVQEYSCNVDWGVCRFPTRARFSAESVGVNVVKTVEQAGMQIRF
ncbi:MAG: DUF2284 domain-containing protein, partial [Methanospirillum sp.]|nr:DUF2284 domain-containing protein [Methanospirillum sp.]